MSKKEMPVVRVEEITQDNGGVMGPWTSSMCRAHEVKALQSYAEQATEERDRAVEFIEKLSTYSKSVEIEGFFDRFTLSIVSGVYDGFIAECRNFLKSLKEGES